ncbi:MAG: MBL fold metallo-hydrolase [Candidatus Niyogibacteria bacterium]|nr:MAG: MBL fold metallo-hydrolase [Candidatus Niyogibacteria bacterium]
MKLSFYGGAQEVTGACYLLETAKTKILVDCGLFQCPKICEARNHEPFPFNASEIKAVFITHAHVDHIGRIPKLFKERFAGKVYSTPATKELAKIMLEDNLQLLKKGLAENGKKGLLFDENDLASAMQNWEDLEYHEEKNIGDFKIQLLDAGHILGSAMIEITAGAKKFIFSGDLGNPPAPLLRPTEKITGADFLTVESTYGDRLHEDREQRKLKIERVIENTIKKKGVLMIPAFSLERTQELLFELNSLVEEGRIPEVPVFLDSPLAIRATEVYRKYERYYNKEAKYIIDSGDKVFKFPMLKFTLTTEESKQINEVPAPKIIIAGSGMSTGGRILHHERRYLSDPNSAILMIGYQAAGSRGRQIQDGARSVKIFGEDVPIKCGVETIQGYSAHPDREMLLDFIRNSADTLKKVFIVQGEPAAALFLVQRVRDYLGIDAVAPRYGESFEF